MYFNIHYNMSHLQLHYLNHTGSVPGIAASNNATCEFTTASNLVPAALNNLDSLEI